MPSCFFSTDLHGHVDRYHKLIDQIIIEEPDLVLLGGDLLPHGFGTKSDFNDFFEDFLLKEFLLLKKKMGSKYPEVMLILGNDDARINEQDFIDAQNLGVWTYMHEQKKQFQSYTIYGYAYVPPTPFQLKDWERYDVSRYADPGCIHPLEGRYSVEPKEDIEYQTIKEDLDKLCADDDLRKAIFLFHSPPYQTFLDRAALDGKMIDHVPMDVHVGSIAIKRFIEERQPLMTLHGHIHESTRITGHWNEKIGKTISINGSTDSPELSLIIFNLEDLNQLVRRLL